MENLDLDMKSLVECLSNFLGRLFARNHDLMKRSENEELFGSESFHDILSI